MAEMPQPSGPGPQVAAANEADALYQEGCAFQGAAVVALVRADANAPDGVEGGLDGAGSQPTAMEIMMEDGVLMTVELDSGEKRLTELGYKQDLRRTLVRNTALIAMLSDTMITTQPASISKAACRCPVH